MSCAADRKLSRRAICSIKNTQVLKEGMMKEWREIYILIGTRFQVLIENMPQNILFHVRERL